MPDTTVRIPAWADPQQASVLDPWWKRTARMLGQVLGANDPQAQAMGIAAPLEIPSGQTVRAFHGSPRDFQNFDMAQAGTVTDPGLLGKGAYFSTDRNVAAQFPRQYQAELGISNPLQVEMTKWGQDKKQIVKSALGLSHDATAAEITKAAQARGYDSVVMDYSPLGYHHHEIAVFEPQHISHFQPMRNK